MFSSLSSSCLFSFSNTVNIVNYSFIIIKFIGILKTMLMTVHIKASTARILHNIDGIFSWYLNIDYVEKNIY
jgi:hypothetical protein